MKYIQEIKRKMIHLSSLWIPIIYIYKDQEFMLKLLIILSIIALIIDILRKIITPLNNLVNIIIGDLMRENEKTASSFSGATYLYISSALTVYFFSKETAIFALFILMISDSFAALIGKKFGKVKLMDKSLEGSISFALSAMIIYYILNVYFNFSLPLIASIFAILASTIAELFAKRIRIDDNFIIPLAIGICLL